MIATIKHKMNINKYLNRINYTGALSPTIENLYQLQRAHLLNVPFENLDIHYAKPIELNISKFYEKIVINRRGGFCYELNGLFNSLLKALGYNTKIISARVYNNKINDFGKEYDHLAIIVEVNKVEYLVDVGFGEFSLHPLKLAPGHINEDPRGNFTIEADENGYFEVFKLDGSAKATQYIFIKKEREFSEFSGMCNYHQTSPDSHFTQKKLISKPTATGRVTLTGNTLKITKGVEIIKEEQFNDDEFEKYLQEYFDIDKKIQHSIN